MEPLTPQKTFLTCAVDATGCFGTVATAEGTLVLPISHVQMSMEDGKKSSSFQNQALLIEHY